FRGSPENSVYGPLDAESAFTALVRSLAQTATVLALGLVAIASIRTRPLWAAAIALMATTGDLAVANACYVSTIPQTVFETTPELCRILQEYERAHPTPGPFRVHRMPLWVLPKWMNTSSIQRNHDIVSWELDTIMGKHGINHGIAYAHTTGVAEL